jgi:hypothetical protein
VSAAVLWGLLAERGPRIDVTVPVRVGATLDHQHPGLAGLGGRAAGPLRIKRNMEHHAEFHTDHWAMGRTGLEPVTSGLSSRRSPN